MVLSPLEIDLLEIFSIKMWKCRSNGDLGIHVLVISVFGSKANHFSTSSLLFHVTTTD